MDHRDLLGDYIKEECGVLGICIPGEQVANTTFFGLFALQHRGQESAGIAVSDGNRVHMEKGNGLVNTVFNQDLLNTMQGDLSIGHTRYSTTGGNTEANVQPIPCTTTYGDIAIAHNGNLINAVELRAELEAEGEVFYGTSDSEVLARIFALNLSKGVEDAAREVMRKCLGAFSVAVLTPTQIIGFRDPNGIRPLVVGRIGESGWMLASETCAFGPVGATPEVHIQPGQIVVIDKSGYRLLQGVESKGESLCLFETIYFARPDSEMFGTGLYGARVRMGEGLAMEHPVEADIVVPVPDSGTPAALGFSKRSGIPFREGMVKSRYIHRTFIQPDQRMRELGVRMKLTPLPDHLVGKRIVLVDDSIVRGTTTKQLVKMMFESGAVEVHVRITAPPIKHPCFYGIDMASKSELAAAIMTLEALQQDIGATSLGFLSVEEAQKAVHGEAKGFCTACFTGSYPIPIPEGLEKGSLEKGSKVGEMATVLRGQGVLPSLEK
jgi:amidophosphoribosyltransferase